MRAAQVGDYRRTLREKGNGWPVRIVRLAFSNVPGIGTGEIAFASPVTFFAGPNGVGKTTFLRGCWAALAPTEAQDSSGSHRRFSGGSVEVDLIEHGRTHECHTVAAAGVFTGDAGHGIEVVHLDTAWEVHRQQGVYEAYQEIENYTEGAGAHQLTDKELVEVAYLTRRDYRSATLYEVETMGPVFPFFEVAYSDDRYDSRTMGAGELAAFMLWWVVRRAAERSVLLIEEPETFLSPASQEALGAHLVAEACKKKLCVVATTHSAPIIVPMPEDSLRFVVRDRGSVSVQSDAPAIVFKNLGIDPPVEAVLFVEDELGCAFAKALLEKFEPRLGRRVDVTARGGAGEVANALRHLRDTERVRFLGLLDGDMRGKSLGDIASRCLYLPGDGPMEKVFRNMVSDNPKTLADLTGSDRIPAILASLEGRDHHDWFRDVAAELSYTQLQLFPLMFAIWSRDPSNTIAARECVAGVQRALDPDPEAKVVDSASDPSSGAHESPSSPHP